MARMTFSLTPVFLSSISRSVDRSKRAGREPIIVMMDLSLKPALTSLTTAALVSGVLLEVCAHKAVEPMRRQRTRRRLRLNRKPIITCFLTLLLTTTLFSDGPRIILNMIVVAAANALDVVARLFKRGHSVNVIETPPVQLAALCTAPFDHCFDSSNPRRGAFCKLIPVVPGTGGGFPPSGVTGEAV